MNIGIIGSRTWPSRVVIEEFVDYLKDFDWTLVSGGCKGSPDKYAEDMFDKFSPKRKKIIHEAEWTKYGKRAGLIRNPYIARDSDFLVCFWDPESQTSGCIDTCAHMQKLKKPGIIVIPKKRMLNNLLENTSEEFDFITNYFVF
jgi:hypothetical protein